VNQSSNPASSDSKRVIPYFCIMKAFQTLLFYNYTPIAEPEQFAADHLRFCEKTGLLGRIIVASEGLNGTVSGTVLQIRKYKDYLRSMPAFASQEFKIDEVDAPSFERLYVRVKPEIVHSGLVGEKLIDPNRRTGIHLKPAEVDRMLGREDVVFLDVRSNYEHEVGRFRGARTLNIDHFRDFPARIAEIEDLKDKKVVTYCTGGIKCEKASGFLLEQGFKEVYQVDGGIVKYAKETGGSGFEGKLYVFDNRVVVDVNSVSPSIISSCRNCKQESARMVNCANPECNEHFVLCEDCGWEMEGCCSNACRQSPAKRAYNGSGYYAR